jgi:hypothetical protein
MFYLSQWDMHHLCFFLGGLNILLMVATAKHLKLNGFRDHSRNLADLGICKGWIKIDTDVENCPICRDSDFLKHVDNTIGSKPKCFGDNAPHVLTQDHKHFCVVLMVISQVSRWDTASQISDRVWDINIKVFHGSDFRNICRCDSSVSQKRSKRRWVVWVVHIKKVRYTWGIQPNSDFRVSPKHKFSLGPITMSVVIFPKSYLFLSFYKLKSC